MKLITSISLFITAAGLVCCGKAPAPSTAPPPPTVVVSEVLSEDIPIIVQVSGTVQGSRQVAIKPQVSGTIEQRLFDEGSEVQEGDPLYRIDPRLFQARLDAAQAQLAVDQANLEFADAEVERRAIEVQKSYKHYWVVRKGLEADERVISAGTPKVRKSGMMEKIAEPAGKEKETKASDTAG